mmetsp:Transcript_45797/g.141718  ORF Transcript_45797/g.141718 Transcript_45797/m.141718 type:complete len:243 (-) Transcript_45797:1209-1937(-)
MLAHPSTWLQKFTAELATPPELISGPLASLPSSSCSATCPSPGPTSRRSASAGASPSWRAASTPPPRQRGRPGARGRGPLSRACCRSTRAGARARARRSSTPGSRPTCPRAGSFPRTLPAACLALPTHRPSCDAACSASQRAWAVRTYRRWGMHSSGRTAMETASSLTRIWKRLSATWTTSSGGATLRPTSTSRRSSQRTRPSGGMRKLKMAPHMTTELTSTKDPPAASLGARSLTSKKLLK